MGRSRPKSKRRPGGERTPGLRRLQQLGRAADTPPAADGTLEQHVALGLRQATPNSVGLANVQSVRAALVDHRAAAAHFLGALFTLHACAAPLTVGMEEHRRVDSAA